MGDWIAADSVEHWCWRDTPREHVPAEPGQAPIRTFRLLAYIGEIREVVWQRIL